MGGTLPDKRDAFGRLQGTCKYFSGEAGGQERRKLAIRDCNFATLN